MVQSGIMVGVRTRTRGETTRARLLELAEASVLAKGFAATTIDELIAGAGITKSGFFYHFKDKGDLARALLERYLDEDEALFDQIFAQAAELSEDPLHRYLIGLKLFADVMGNLPELHPGCLVASYCYQEQQFSESVRRIGEGGALQWRGRFLNSLRNIAARYPPKRPVDIEALADMITVLVEGGIILSRMTRSPALLARQVMMYRALVRETFQP